VLEGLNAVLDHRGELFIPELNMTFAVPTGTRLFACQNPVSEGGNRRGLPKSFLNRFTRVRICVFVSSFGYCCMQRIQRNNSKCREKWVKCKN